MADADTTPKTRAKPGRKPSTPNLENVIAAIDRGDYDSNFLALAKAIQDRNHVRQDAVLKLVQETFGSEMTVVPKNLANKLMGSFMDGEVIEPAPAKTNPFLKKAATAAVELEKTDNLQYRISPHDDVAYRRDFDATVPPGMVRLIAEDGAGTAGVPEAEFQKWPIKVSPSGDDDTSIVTDALSGGELDATEAKMAAEREEPSAGAQIPAQTVQVQPDIEMRGAAISGLHSSDIE